MRKEYDFSNAQPNPYVERLKQSVTIRLDSRALEYFKDLSTRTGIPYQTLINLYLRDCALNKRKLKLTWKPPKRARSNKRLKLTGGDRSKGNGVLCAREHELSFDEGCANWRVARSLSAIR